MATLSSQTSAMGSALRSSLRACGTARSAGASSSRSGTLASIAATIPNGHAPATGSCQGRRSLGTGKMLSSITAAAPASTSLLLSRTIPLRRSAHQARSVFQRDDRRALHSLPDLPVNVRDAAGCEPLFSETTVKLIWEDWQAGLLNKLNDEVRGTQWENMSIAETVLDTARDPHAIQAFNYASLALNNSFFMAGLKPKELPIGMTEWADAPPPQPPNAIVDRIEKDFESLAAFKSAFSAMAYGMVGSGYVWLVQDAHGVLGIVPTYGAGTVLVQNRLQREAANYAWTQPSVVQTTHSASAASEQTEMPSEAEDRSMSASARSISNGGTRPFSTSAIAQRPPFGRVNSAIGKSEVSSIEQRGEELFPLMCLSVHEHDWLPDYGMMGKEEYLRRFWECVDWQRVQRLHQSYNIM